MDFVILRNLHSPYGPTLNHGVLDLFSFVHQKSYNDAPVHFMVVPFFPTSASERAAVITNNLKGEETRFSHACRFWQTLLCSFLQVIMVIFFFYTERCRLSSPPELPIVNNKKNLRSWFYFIKLIRGLTCLIHLPALPAKSTVWRWWSDIDVVPWWHSYGYDYSFLVS